MDGACVVVAVAVGKALYKQLSALPAGRRAGAALPELNAEKKKALSFCFQGCCVPSVVGLGVWSVCPPGCVRHPVVTFGPIVDLCYGALLPQNPIQTYFLE